MALFTVVVSAKYIIDSTGFYQEVPTLIAEDGEVTLVNDYIQSLLIRGKSLSTIRVFLQGISLFIDYLIINSSNYIRKDKLFEGFVTALSEGTTGEDGLDPSELYWFPRTTTVVRNYAISLSAYFEWVSHELNTPIINPIIDESNVADIISYTAWYIKNQQGDIVKCCG